jgi:hypothetical protein
MLRILLAPSIDDVEDSQVKSSIRILIYVSLSIEEMANLL